MSDEWPTVGIALLTYLRLDYTIMCIASMSKHLQYSGKLVWYVADDGSGEEYMEKTFDCLKRHEQELYGHHSERIGPGPSWTRACESLLQGVDYIFWLENDWIARYDVYIDPYMKLLIENQDVGMVRMGHMATGLILESTGYDGIHYLNVLKDRQYCYSGNPSLRTRKYFMHYGYYPTDPAIGPGDCELAHDHSVRKNEGPQIWWPIDVGGWGAFAHIGTDQSY